MTLTTRRLVVVILFLGLFAMAVRVAVDSDTFWHLRSGAWMLDNGRLLDFDVFSHTRLNQPWINHSWLSEIPMALLYRLGGFGALNLATAAIIWLTFLFVYLSGEGGPYLRAFSLVLAAAASAVYWSARPQIVSLLLAAIFSHVLILYRRRGRNYLWLLPLLMLAWANLHGGFAIGFILLVITLAGQLGEFVAGAEHDHRGVVRIAATGMLCAAAVTVNPYGPQLLLYPFKTVSIGALQNYIQEWQSPNFHNREAQVFIVLWLAVFGAVGLSRRRLDLTDFLLFSAFSGLALLAGRNIAVFAVVAAPILMQHGASAVAELQERWPRLRLGPSSGAPSPAARTLNWILASLVAAAVLLKAALPLAPAATEQAIAQYAPVGAAGYFQTTGVPGRMFNSYNFGGYLAWRLYPAQRIYVDGRTDLYDDVFLSEYLNAYQAGPGWQQTFGKYGIGSVVVEPGAPIARELIQTPGWAVRYSDPVAVVLVKIQ